MLLPLAGTSSAPIRLSAANPNLECEWSVAPSKRKLACRLLRRYARVRAGCGAETVASFCVGIHPYLPRICEFDDRAAARSERPQNALAAPPPTDEHEPFDRQT